MNILAIIIGVLLLVWPVWILLQLFVFTGIKLVLWLDEWAIILGLALLVALGGPILAYGLGVWTPWNP